MLAVSLAHTPKWCRVSERQAQGAVGAAVCGGLITVDGNHMIAYTHPDVVAAQIRQAATSAVR